jgi:hypothetical protein
MGAALEEERSEEIMVSVDLLHSSKGTSAGGGVDLAGSTTTATTFQHVCLLHIKWPSSPTTTILPRDELLLFSACLRVAMVNQLN